jgi:protein-disulfide isomerase
MSATSPTRKERRDLARQERVAREQAAAVSATRRRRFTRLGAVVAVAAVAVVVLVAVSSSGKSATTAATSSSAPVKSAGASAAMLSGIPQHGLTLGNPKAPVRVVEFADLQCPFCRAYSVNVLPGLVQKYVRPGKVRMDFRTLAFIGPDSVRAGRVAEAAGQQNKLWNFADLMYLNQGEENSGYATDAYLKRIGGAVPGLDTAKAFQARNGSAVTAQLKAASDLANTSGVNETPTFLVGRGTSLKAVDAAGLPAALKAAAGS